MIKGIGLGLVSCATALAGLPMLSGCSADGLDAQEDVAVTTSALNCPGPMPIGVDASPNAIRPATNAIDGNNSTRWESDRFDNQFITIDLGVIMQVASVTLNWNTACGRDYNIDVAQGATGSWGRLATVAGNAQTGVITHLGDHGAVKGRYVRLTGLSRCISNRGFSLYEFQANGLTTKCYVDADGDGQGAGGFVEACGGCPAGRVSNANDCYDSNANAKTGQSSYFNVNRGDGSYDYNCNSSQEPQSITAASGCAAGAVYPNCTQVNGVRPVAACGATVSVVACAAIPATPVQSAHCQNIFLSGPAQPCR